MLTINQPGKSLKFINFQHNDFHSFQSEDIVVHQIVPCVGIRQDHYDKFESNHQ